jgi:uncharacterized protein YndB with AHSA1/START domain
MTEPSTEGASTRVSRIIKAPRSAIYHAFLDRDALAAWLPPETMKGHVHTFEPREGGKFRLSLTYEDPEHSHGGKTTQDSDTVQGRFVELAPDEKIVWVVEFESQDPSFAGEMTITFSLAEADGGTEVIVLCEDIPKGVRLEDNEMGCRSSLQNLAALVERGIDGQSADAGQ